ncbi:MAG: hypothetical protein H6730_34295 [Deltaproteobacteria bacterium]|nr:hypothetical protein [Deltaproteobacteria bacterium]
MPAVLGWGVVLLAAAAAVPRVSVTSDAPDFLPLLAEELGPEALFTTTATGADVRVTLQGGGRALSVHDGLGRLLLERTVATYDEAARRAFVAMVAQAVRHPPEPLEPAPTPAGPPPPSPGDLIPLPPPDAAPRLPPAPPPRVAREAPPEAPPRRETGPVRLGAEAGFRLFGSPRAARATLDLVAAGHWGAWRAALRVGGEAGADLRTIQLDARVGGVRAVLEGGRRLLTGDVLDLEATLGAGAAVYLGKAEARSPPFADPGAPQDLRLWTAVLVPSLLVRWSTAGPELTLRAGAQVALATHQVNLPAVLGVTTTEPLVTPRWTPELALGVAWPL